MKQSLINQRNSSAQLMKAGIFLALLFGSLGVIGGGFYFSQIFSPATKTKMINNSSHYREIRHKLWSNSTQIQHFPSDISPAAKNVSLSYSPGGSQTNSFFQVRMKLSPSEIQKILLTYRPQAQRVYHGGNTNDHANLPKGIPTTFFYTSNTTEDSFPPSYEILVLGANDRGNTNFPWNHGDSYGVAIDSSTSDIVYWAEAW
ncbi:hypothetical protein [Calothrix sp. 336/3]|uniref:hypothetical protein n=1 Tax=Calothrix sp. 336/3 TaxID=1337936 RepID=UPI0004E44809|nr:hypothetical protein [Calothrix sp. 336/3]AKG22087.1 hypothetical protein IJ00_13215 [Calothrix sp. 336/3]